MVDDTIHLENAVFTALPLCWEPWLVDFVKNTTGKAADGNDRVIYDGYRQSVL